MRLITRVHFQSRDKMVVTPRPIRPASVHVKPTTPCKTRDKRRGFMQERELLLIVDLHNGNIIMARSYRTGVKGERSFTLQE